MCTHRLRDLLICDACLVRSRLGCPDVVNPAGGSEHCPRKTPQPKPQPFVLPAASRIVLLPTAICLEPNVQYSIDISFSLPSEGELRAPSHILVDSLGLIPQIKSLENFCSKQDLDEYQLHNCVEIALATGPQPASVTRRARWGPTAADLEASASASLV
nr:laminin subunit beta-4-like [Camelus dromedarius]